MSSAPEQELVHRGIGASEAAAAVGLSPWVPPIALYERLVGISVEQEESPALRWGKLLEQPIRQAYVERTGSVVLVPPRSLFMAEYPWRRATPDGLVVAGLGEWLTIEQAAEPDSISWGLEIKTADGRAADDWGPDGSDEVPVQYAVQCAWSMHVMNLDRWDLAVLIGGRDFRVYTLRRDREFEQELVANVSTFWEEHVQRLVPPPPDHTPAFRRFLERRYPHSLADYLPAEPAADALVRRILERRVRLAELERADARDCNELRAVIGEHSGLVASAGKVHWKPQKGRLVTDWKAVAETVALQAGMPTGALAEIAAGHSRAAKESRPLRLPRVKGAADDEGTEEGA